MWSCLGDQRREKGERDGSVLSCSWARIRAPPAKFSPLDTWYPSFFNSLSLCPLALLNSYFPKLFFGDPTWDGFFIYQSKSVVQKKKELFFFFFVVEFVGFYLQSREEVRLSQNQCQDWSLQVFSSLLDEIPPLFVIKGCQLKRFCGVVSLVLWVSHDRRI